MGRRHYSGATFYFCQLRKFYSLVRELGGEGDFGAPELIPGAVIGRSRGVTFLDSLYLCFSPLCFGLNTSVKLASALTTGIARVFLLAWAYAADSFDHQKPAAGLERSQTLKPRTPPDKSGTTSPLPAALQVESTE